MPLTVSIALCTHNGERFIAQQLRSILGQTRLATQLVISDDDSTDGTVALVTETIAEWRRGNPGVQLEVLRINNPVALGVTENFAGAIAAATGDLIALSDQDDVWLPVRLERMVAEFESRPDLLLLHTDAALIDGTGLSMGDTLFGSLGVNKRMIQAVHNGNAFQVLMRRNIVTGATTVFRGVLAETARPFPESWLHDEWLAIAAAATGVVDLLEETLLEYRQHASNEIGVERLSVVGKTGRILQPGADRNRRLLLRAEQLAERIPELDTTRARRDAAVEKMRHEQVRSGLRRSRWSRVATITRELSTGRYRQFGRGFADAIRDLLQPL